MLRARYADRGRTAIYLLQDINLIAGPQTSLELTLAAANGDVPESSFRLDILRS